MPPKRQTATKTEYDIRMSLLEHYSSETISHSALLAGLTLVLLPVLQERLSLGLNGPPLSRALLDSGLYAILIIGVQIGGRTLYWGWLAAAIVRGKRTLGENVPLTISKDKEFMDSKLETFVLYTAAHNFVKEYHPTICRYFSSLSMKRVEIFIISLPIACIVAFCIEYLLSFL